MKRFYTLFVLFAILTSCSNESVKGLDIYQLKGNIKSLKVSTYEAESKFGEILKGDLVYNGISIVEFNESGLTTYSSRYKNNGELLNRGVFTYIGDKTDNIVYYDSNGELLNKEIYTWENGKLLKYAGYNKEGKEEYKTVYEYDGKKIKSYSNYFDGELYNKIIATKYIGDLSSEEITYDKDGKEIEKATFKIENKRVLEYISNKRSYYNNKQGLTVKSINCYHIMVFGSAEEGVFYYEYEYDNKDNWIKCITYKGESKQPYQVIEREITYR